MILFCGLIGAFFGFAFAAFNNTHECMRNSEDEFPAASRFAIMVIGVAVGAAGGMFLGAMAG